ncbi:nuclear/nucleolar GTP-binding protein [Aureobasidium subglaciale]|nr:nuclear/nucleolar GTP-binding protein [Aureobasidium subglaciale]KAI5230722.1 nuclear/nucleolar GTP-binding protein [Aureobasidium subglaciale]KAI5233776.1 nuclear/nucleolar GTP-binding protein [Aureobasidium subglaciale]KAI5253955.1 nuclear/nucleolar GTP-binding protein [Aureobasidium subglaciale]KAI5267277.1 nuclear/nucleolar GTP-binding protein [Aureobasidium subglaciale]
MGTGKKEAARKTRQGKVGDGMANVKVKGENFYRDAKKVKKLNILTKGTAQRNASGDITKAAVFQSRERPSARIEPNRKWFTNTRVISQDALSAFRGAVQAQQKDPYSYLLKQNKLPMSLIKDDETKKNGLKQHQAKIAVETAPFSDTFGPKAQRKRPKLAVSSLLDLAGESDKMHETYVDRLEQARLASGLSVDDAQDAEVDGALTAAREAIFSKGQSKRIWNELYKVIDSSDVVIHVLDARDPLGTRCRSVEKYIREEAPHKHLLFVLNKCDLIPTSVAANWVRLLGKEYPTLAFHASINNSFGKGSLISLLRQFSALHSSRKQISVGFIGYPNTGKSSIINTLRKKKVCNVAPIPGETKVWQYITLMKRIYLIDCPGVVPPNMGDTDEDILLRGVVRIENVENPEQYVAAALRKCKRHHVERTYDVRDWETPGEFLELLARKGGKLLKGGEADMDGVAKMVLNDFLRGKIPWFTPPPASAAAWSAAEEAKAELLTEIIKKRKRGAADEGGEAEEEEDEEDDEDEEDEEFASFTSDEEDEDDVEEGVAIEATEEG